MSNQYEVLGKAPQAEDLKKLSPNNVHLTIKNMNAGYGKMEILHNFDLFVSKAQSLCLIGPNGAGKSTILHSIYGFTNIFSGQIEIDGKEITNLTPAEKLKSVGIAYILQDNSVFPDMTVEENLLMGGFIKEKTEGVENDLIIRKFTSEGVTVNHIKSYIRHLISTGFQPDMVVLDYIDCVESTRRYNDEWSGEGNVMRAFESMLAEYNLVGWTAVQGNRSSVSADVVTGDQMGGSIKKAQIGHFIMSIARTLSQKEGNRATIAVLKSRFGKDGVIFEDCTFDNGRVYIDTESSETFLGYERKVVERKEENAKERLKMAKVRREKRDTELD